MKVIRIVSYIGDKQWVNSTIENSLSEEGLILPGRGEISICTVRNAEDLKDIKETVLKDWR